MVSKAQVEELWEKRKNMSDSEAGRKSSMQPGN